MKNFLKPFQSPQCLNMKNGFNSQYSVYSIAENSEDEKIPLNFTLYLIKRQ